MIGDILQPTHLLFILVVALLVLGPKRLPEVGRSLGRGMRDFRNAISGDDHHDHQDEIGPDASAPSEPTEVTAPEPHIDPASHAAPEPVVAPPPAATPPTNGTQQPTAQQPTAQQPTAQQPAATEELAERLG